MCFRKTSYAATFPEDKMVNYLRTGDEKICSDVGYLSENGGYRKLTLGSLHVESGVRPRYV